MLPSLCFCSLWQILFLPALQRQTAPSIIFKSVSENQKKKTHCFGESKTIPIWFGIAAAALCMHTADNTLFTDWYFIQSRQHISRDVWEKWHVFFTAVGMNLLCGCLVNRNSSPERGEAFPLLSGSAVIFYYYDYCCCFPAQAHYLHAWMQRNRIWSRQLLYNRPEYNMTLL